MARYDLLLNANASQVNQRGQSVEPDGPTNPKMPPLAQAFQLVVSGIGTVSATVQVLASNDGTNWVDYGDAVTATGTITGQAAWAGNQPFRHYAAILTAISGTGAAATLRMSA